VEKLIGVCGITCTECLAFIATQKDNNDERAKVAETWSKQFSSDIKPENINCNGCISEGDVHFMYCDMCEIRKCGVERKLDNCAYCDDYICEKLEGFFKMAPEAKVALDGIRESLV